MGPHHTPGEIRNFNCLSAHSFMLLVFDLKITSKQNETIISQYITTSMIFEQAKLQLNKIKESFSSFFSQLSSLIIQ